MSRTNRPLDETANAIKASFHDIYREPDPRAYYRVLGGLDYVIPDVARPIFSQLIDRREATIGREVRVLDLGCSYGVNAAQLRFGLGLRQLRQRYLAPSIARLSSATLVAHDARYFAGWPARSGLSMIGLDASPEAIAYATKAGLLNAGIVADLEAHDPDNAAADLIARADMIISTGCVGYVTDKTFNRLLDVIPDEKPWIASFVLRMFSYETVAAALGRAGYVTEKLPGATFVQRRFHDRAEMERTVEAVRALGGDPAGKEADGLLHAEFFLSRPAREAAVAPLTDIVSLSSGIARPIGDREGLSLAPRHAA